MNTEKMKSIIMDEVIEKITQVVEEMSTNDFIEKVQDKYYTETGMEIDEDEEDIVHSMIGDKVLPLYHKLSEYIVEHHLK